MAALVEDTIVYPTLISLAACLCYEMEAANGPSLCSCGLVTGEVALDYCHGGCDGTGCGGQAWVRFTDAYLSSTFPLQNSDLANCKAPLAFTLEVGVARCAPLGENSAVNGYSPPNTAQNVAAVRLQLADMAAMRRAIQCCFGDNERDYIMGAYTQIDVNGGGCVGGTFSVSVWESF